MPKKINKLFLIIFFFALMFSCITKVENAYADTGTLNPTDDTFYDDLLGTSYGGKGMDTKRGTDGDFNCLPYKVNWVGTMTDVINNGKASIRFDLSHISGTITGAELRIYVPAGGKYFTQDPATTDFYLYSSNDDAWDETAEELPATSTQLQKFNTVTEGNWNSFNVTNFIKSEYSGDKIASFVLNSNKLSDDDIFAFSSDEDYAEGSYDWRPQLVITYNPNSASIAATTEMTEGNLDTNSIDVTLSEDSFVDTTLDKANFTLNNAPAGLTIEDVTYTDNTHCAVNLAYDGTDFDSKVTNLGVTIKGAELNGGSDLTASNQLEITATNDDEVITISDDGNITEGSENGEIITVDLTGGTFVNSITPSNWTVSNLPAGVSKGNVTRVSPTEIQITLSGNATGDYDTNITNVTVACTTAEYLDSTGGSGLSANSGVTLIANTDPIVTTDDPATAVASTTATIGGNVTSDGGLTVTARGIEYKKHNAGSYTQEQASTNGTGNFSVNLTGLDPATTYDVRAYATNDDGTSYGTVVSFTTTNTDPTISDITDKLTNEDASITNISFTIGDAETPAESLIVSATSDNLMLIPNAAYSFGGSGADRTLTINPALNQYGTANVTVTVSDGSGGTAQDTFKVTVNPVNDAPELLPFLGLFNIINEDDITTIGNPVSTIAGPIMDVDMDDNGIAITSTTITTGNGNWQYSTDGGANWHDIGVVSENSALLLNITSMVRFVPDEKNGATGSITYRAWDKTSGTQGYKVDTTQNGGTSAFSTNTNTANINVMFVNDAPVLEAVYPSLTTIVADEVNNSGQTVASFIGSSISDVDSGALKGIAVTATASGNGTWEYSIDNGSTWTGIGAVTGSSALLLRDTDKVRFVPNGQDSTTALVAYRAWDRTSGSEGNKADTATNGGITAFSTATDTASITVNKIPPKIQTVNVPSDGTYKAGDNLDFTVNFNENVDVTGLPQLVLTIGSTTRTATYVSGSGTWALLFRYTVQAGDNDNDGIAINLLELNGGTIKDSATNNATLTLNGVASTTGVKVDAAAPTVQSVAVPSNGTYKAGENLDFTVNYSEAVVVIGTPQLSLSIEGVTRTATYVSGTGTSALVFRYTVQAGDSDNDGITVSGLELNGGTIKDSIGNDATLTLNGVGVTTGVKVDTIAPTINSSSLAGSNEYVDITFSEGVYGANDGTSALTADKFALTFTQNGGTATNVTISSIKKNDNTTEGSASALTGGETTVRVFLNVAGTPSGLETIEINPANASSIYDKTGNALSIAQTTGVKTLNDKVAPTVQSVAVPSDGTYKIGDNLDFTVNFNKTVTVTGTPQLSLSIGGATRKADYVSGTSALVFRYTVQAGDSDNDGITVNGLELNGGTIKDGVGNDGTLTLSGVESTTGVKVDAVAPTVQSVAVPSDGTYKIGDNLNFTVNFNKTVTVTGTPQLSLSIGGTTRKADYVSGTSALVFIYTVQAGDNDNDGIAINLLELNGGTIKDSATNNATLTLNGVASTTGVKVDAAAPTVQSVAVPSNGTYKAGENLDFTVNYSEAVVVIGTPQLSLSIEGVTRTAPYVSGTGTSALVFSYTVQAGDSDNNGITVSGLELNGGTIRDSIGNDATLTLNGVGATSGIKVDTTAPIFNPATGTAIDSTFKTVTLTFSENIINALVDIYSLKNAVTFAADGINYNALGTDDTVTIVSGKLIVTFESSLIGSTNKIKIAGNSLKDVGGNLLTDLITTNSIIIATVPAAPTGVSATAGNGSAVISFTAPVDNGGSPITGYKVTSTPGNIIATGNGSPITITGLTNGTSYTFTVTATNAIGTSIASATSNGVAPTAPYIPPSGGGSQPNTEPKQEQITVNVTDGTNNNVLSGTTIQRTTETDGTKKDAVQYTADKAQETVEKLKEAGKDTARLVIPDEKDEVAEAEIKIPTTTLSIIAQGNINLQIDTENARISLSKDSIKNLDEDLKQDLFFRVVPIKEENQRKEIVERAKQEEIVKQAAKGSDISVVGRPMTIETNMSQRSVDIVLPLRGVTIPSDPKAREEFFSKIGIFIEHSDGEKALTKGEVVEYKNGVFGIKFTIKKFSTFTIIKLNEGEFDENGNISSNGGYGGPKTFMPDKEITISFNKELNEGTLTKDSIYVEDSKGNKVEAVLKYNDTGKTVAVTPSKYYNTSETYYLCVTDKLLSTTGKSITKKVRYSFNIGSVGLDRTKIYGEYKDVSQNKVWTVKLNEAIDLSKLNSANIKVYDENCNEVEVVINNLTDNKTISIAPKNAFQKGKSYYLFVNDIISEKGTKLNEAQWIKYTIIKN